jgi:hypothetical protein
MTRDYLRWQTVIPQGFLRMISLAACLLGHWWRQKVRHTFDTATPPRPQRYVANFASRNFEGRRAGHQVGENFIWKQRLGGFDVEGLCVHILQHPSEKGCDKES